MGDIFFSGENQCNSIGVKKYYFGLPFIWDKNVFWWWVTHGGLQVGWKVTIVSVCVHFLTFRHTDTKGIQSLKIYFAYSIVKIVSIENEKSVLTSIWFIHTKIFTQTILGINAVDLKIIICTTFMYLFLNICIKLNIRIKPDTFS